MCRVVSIFIYIQVNSGLYRKYQQTYALAIECISLIGRTHHNVSVIIMVIRIKNKGQGLNLMLSISNS